MSDSKTLPPEFAATAGDLMAYRARERFNLFELACLLHRADPERVHNDTWNGWRDRKLQIGFDRAELTPALFIGELDLMPELLAGPLIGGTIKQLKKAIGCATIMHSIGADQARTLADSLGLAFPPELSAAQPPQPAPQAAKRRTRTMSDAVLPYMRRVFEAGQFATAKELYKALEGKAGQSDSPFERGSGDHRGSLFVREFSKPLALKTVQNSYWPKLTEPD